MIGSSQLMGERDSNASSAVSGPDQRLPSFDSVRNFIDYGIEKVRPIASDLSALALAASRAEAVDRPELITAKVQPIQKYHWPSQDPITMNTPSRTSSTKFRSAPTNTAVVQATSTSPGALHTTVLSTMTASSPRNVSPSSSSQRPGKYQCPFESCGRFCDRPSVLKTHIRTHTGERPFQCPHCPKGFAARGTLNAHIRVHTNERPFRCEARGCSKAFRQSTHLVRHMLIRHNVQLPNRRHVKPGVHGMPSSPE